MVQSLDKRVAGQISLGEERLQLRPGEDLLHRIQDGVTWEEFSDLVQTLGLPTAPKQHFVYKLQRLVSRNEDKFRPFLRVIIISDFSVIFVPLAEDSVPYSLCLRLELSWLTWAYQKPPYIWNLEFKDDAIFADNFGQINKLSANIFKRSSIVTKTVGKY